MTMVIISQMGHMDVQILLQGTIIKYSVIASSFKIIRGGDIQDITLKAFSVCILSVLLDFKIVIST